MPITTTERLKIEQQYRDATPRVQQMIEQVLAHAELIMSRTVGSVELHFHGESVKSKIHLNLS